MNSTESFVLLFTAVTLCLYASNSISSTLAEHSHNSQHSVKEPIIEGPTGDSEDDENRRFGRDIEDIEDSNEVAIRLNTTASAFKFVHTILATIFSPVTAILKNRGIIKEKGEQLTNQ